MGTTEIVGRTFSYTIAYVVYVIVVQSLESAGERVSAESYMGKQTWIFPDGESLTEDWCCVRDIVERNVESGKYKILR